MERSLEMLQETAEKEYNILMAATHANQGIPAEHLSPDEEINVIMELAGNESIRGDPNFHKYVRNQIWKYLHGSP
jgi:hypothetical protein